MEITNLAENTQDFTGNVWHIKNQGNCLIDAGEGDCWKNIKQLEEIKTVVITHSHHDHIKNLEKIAEKYSPEIYAYQPENLPVRAKKISEKDKISVCGLELEVFHTPGHKDDSVCLYSNKEKILFTGDLIFPEGSFGRTDLAEGDRDKLIKSIEKVSQLEINSFYPGHDSAVTEKAEKSIAKSLENAAKKEPKY